MSNKVDEQVHITINSKTLSYEGTITIRKAHAVLQMIADDIASEIAEA